MSNLKREANVETLVLRDTIPQILARANQPLSAAEIAATPEIAALGLSGTVRLVSNALTGMHKHTAFPDIGRVFQPVPGTATKWGWYSKKRLPFVNGPSEVSTKGKKPPRAKASKPAPTAASASEFQFNPIELQTANPSPVVSLPSGAKSITIEVGGVSVRIDLTG